MARALTLRMIWLSGFMLFPHSTLYHRSKPRRRPVGRNRFDQPASGIFGGKGDPLGLSGIDRQRIQPERLPAVVQPVQQPEMMAVKVERRWRSPRGWSGRGRRCGRPWRGRRAAAVAANLAGATQSAGDPPSVQLDPQGALEVELGRQAVGRQRRRGRQGCVPQRRLIGADQPGDRRGPPCRHAAGWRRPSPAASCASTKASALAARRQHERAVARRERFGGLPVERHDPDLVSLHFQRNDSPLAAIDEAESEPLIGPRPRCPSDRRPLTV